MTSFQVGDPNFKEEEVLYDDDYFVIAWGVYERADEQLAARWKSGFPAVSGRAVWFVISERLSIPFLTSLIGLPGADQEAVLRVLEKQRVAGKLKEPFDVSKWILPNDP